VVGIGVHQHNRVVTIRCEFTDVIREIAEEMAAFG
jgi:hypothetical protein